VPNITDPQEKRNIATTARNNMNRWNSKLPDNPQIVQDMIELCHSCNFPGYVKVFESILNKMSTVREDTDERKKTIENLVARGVQIGDKAVYRDIPVTISEIDPQKTILRVKHVTPPRFNYAVDPRTVKLEKYKTRNGIFSFNDAEISK
jgi:hypothetical protein